MNAITLDRPGAAAVRFTAHQLFGLLLFREQGKTVRHIASLVDLPEASLDAALSVAERGELERVPAYGGTSLKLQLGRKQSAKDTFAAGGSDELFLPRWQRAILRQLARNGGEITVAEANAIRSSYEDGIDAGMTGLHTALKTNRMALMLVDRDGQGIYRLAGEPLERLHALIANRWQLAAS